MNCAMRSSSHRPRDLQRPCQAKTAARHFNWQRYPRRQLETYLHSLATGLLEELRDRAVLPRMVQGTALVRGPGGGQPPGPGPGRRPGEAPALHSTRNRLVARFSRASFRACFFVGADIGRVAAGADGDALALGQVEVAEAFAPEHRRVDLCPLGVFLRRAEGLCEERFEVVRGAASAEARRGFRGAEDVLAELADEQGQAVFLGERDVLVELPGRVCLCGAEARVDVGGPDEAAFGFLRAGLRRGRFGRRGSPSRALGRRRAGLGRAIVRRGASGLEWQTLR